MHALSQGSANYAKGFLSPLPDGQLGDFFNPKFSQKLHNYESLTYNPANPGLDSFIQPLADGQNWDNFFNPEFVGKVGTPGNNQNFNLGTFLGEEGLGLGGMVQGILNGDFLTGNTTLGSKAPEHNTINYMGGKGAEDKVKTSPLGTPAVNNFSISGNNVNNTRANTALGNNTGVFSNGPKNSMGLNGENPTAGAGPWSDGSGSYGTGDGNTWHTDDYDWNGDGGDGGDGSYEDSVVSSVHNPSGEYTETGDGDTGVDDDSDDDDDGE